MQQALLPPFEEQLRHAQIETADNLPIRNAGGGVDWQAGNSSSHQQPVAQCPQLDADKMHEECHFGKTEFNQWWAKFVQLKARQMGRAESNVGLYTKQPAINELINAIGMHTMEALMAGGDEAAKEKAMECAQGRSLGRYAKAALNVALSEGSIEAS